MTSKQAAEVAVNAAMKGCGHCKEKAEWRFKDGWGALACAEWFAGRCTGQPLDVASPSEGDFRPRGGRFDEDEDYKNWVKTRLRAVWPLERPA
ncbi:MAG: hypothetical protein ABIU05_17355 [Nitrospirales bacterium]